MFGRGVAGVSSRFRASSIVAMFSGKSRTVIVLNSALWVTVEPLKPLPRPHSTFERVDGSRYLTSNTRFLKLVWLTPSGSGFWVVFDELAGCANDAEPKINASASVAGAYFKVLNIMTDLLSAFRI